jgi:hypothetical protein
LTWLALHKVEAWKMNTGAMRVPGTATAKQAFVRFAFRGCSDIIGLVPFSGQFLAVECKTGNGELSDDQAAFRGRVMANGGIFIEARSIDDLEAARAIILAGYSLTR